MITGVVFAVAGVLHFVVPGVYLGIMPAWLPWHTALVSASGVFEVLGGLGLLWPRTRRLAGIGLVALLVAVFPANVEMLRLSLAANAPWPAQLALWARLPLQGLLMWWVWRVVQTPRDLAR